MGTHPHENCTKVLDAKQRKRLVSKFGRCFNCLFKGHRVKDCNTQVVGKHCNGKHHTALCEVLPTSQGESRRTDTESTTRVVNNVHIGAGGRVAMQTAQAMLNGVGSGRFRRLFDSASHKSFVTVNAVTIVGLRPFRKEWLAVNTFGRKAKQSHLRDVVQLDIMPVRGGKPLQVEGGSDRSVLYTYVIKVITNAIT